jgi:hypothetical protein
MALTDFGKLLLRPIPQKGASLVPGVALVFGLATIFYFPALILGRTLAHGDIATLDAPFFDFLARVFRGEASGQWVGLYGGHPLFAEGQAAMANPLTIVWAILITPIVGPVYAMNLFRWAIMIAAGIGVIGLCRSLGAKTWSATFAALAVIFSAIWVHHQYALPVFHALCWSPWVLWAMECLLKRPSLRSASALGAASAALLFAGYPQILHGTVLFALATLAVAPLQAVGRREWAESWKQRAAFGGFAIAVGAGLAAAQFLPLIELTGYSHRHGGVGLPFGGLTPFLSYAKGIFITQQSSAGGGYWHGTGSALVVVLAAVCALVPAPARAKSYIAGAALLTILGMEFATPLFNIIYSNHLIPGLHYFRQMAPYLPIATLGIAVAAAFGLEGLAKLISRQTREPGSAWSLVEPARGPTYLLAAGLIGWSAASPRPASNVALQCGILLLCIGIALDLCKRRREKFLASLAVALLVAEILLLRMQPFRYWPSTILSKPPTVMAVQSVPHWRDYRAMDVSQAVLIAFVPERSSDIPIRASQLMGLLTPMTPLRWDIPSMDAHLALPLQRRTAIQENLVDEIFNRNSSKPPGLRYIDFLGVRFIGTGGPLSTPGFRVLSADDRPQSQIAKKGPEVFIMENEAALPRFQVYTSYRIVGSLDAALAAMRELREPSLVVEVPDPARLSGLPPGIDGDGPLQAQAAKLEVFSAADTLYRIKVDARQPVWLFVADANYPGWEATIDGASVPVFSAQVLGKAVAVPAGTHTVAFRFRSRSFQAGLAVTLTTLLATVVLLGWDVRRRGRHRLRSCAEG